MKVSTSKGQFDLVNPSPEQVDFLVIACSLGKLCRFAGHTKGHYSVAEHSFRLAIAVELAGGNEAAQLQALLHDAHEAYTGDITRPMRNAIESLSLQAIEAIEAIENRVAFAIFQKADCTAIPFEVVSRLDSELGEYERLLFVTPDVHYSTNDFADCVLEAFHGTDQWDAEQASTRWLGKLTDLLTPPCG